MSLAFCAGDERRGDKKRVNGRRKERERERHTHTQAQTMARGK